MGYFSNACEGSEYEERWCRRCKHGETYEGQSCPVLQLHFVWNYAQFDRRGLEARPGTKAAQIREGLSIFIPRSDDGLDNEQCKMFLPTDEG